MLITFLSSSQYTPIKVSFTFISPSPAPSSPVPRAVNVETQNFASLRHRTAVGVEGDGGEPGGVHIQFFPKTGTPCSDTKMPVRAHNGCRLHVFC